MPSPRLDAIVVGSGPNGLAAAIELARAGRSVRVYEAAGVLGGGIRSAELTLPGFIHDVCSTVVPLAAGSRFFRSLDTAAYGVEWVHPPAPLAHMLQPDRAVILERDLDTTIASLGRDGPAWGRLFEPLVRDWDSKLLAHVVGWPIVRGGVSRLTDAVVAIARTHGVEFVTDHPVRSLADLPEARAVVLDLTPRQVPAVTGDRLRGRYRGGLERYRYGPGVLKVDWALSGPVPWRDPAAARGGTVHLSGTLRDVASAEDAVMRGGHPDRPFILFVQPTAFDPSRAPEGRHTAWAYTHVPNGSTVDRTEVIEREVERHAPGFRDLILARAVHDPAAMEAYDANYVGGDINGGIQDVRQAFFRPVVRWDPYATPLRGLYLCSSSTPPGGGVHGMSGWHAARSVLRRIG